MCFARSTHTACQPWIRIHNAGTEHTLPNTIRFELSRSLGDPAVAPEEAEPAGESVGRTGRGALVLDPLDIVVTEELVDVMGVVAFAKVAVLEERMTTGTVPDKEVIGCTTTVPKLGVSLEEAKAEDEGEEGVSGCLPAVD